METTKITPYQFKNGKKVLNRIVVPPMASQTADSAGFVTENTIKHYKNLSQSGAGIVFVEYSFVHQSGKGEANQLGVDSDDKIHGLKRLAESIQSSGALAGLQIVHTGGKTSSEITGLPLLGASSISVPVKGWEPVAPIEMSLGEIGNYVQWHLDAALRASKAGFDIVELHAAHGYGLNQWLSPLTNRRHDQYGGGLENRARILVEIVQAAKALEPEMLLSVRIPAQDHIQDGLQISDMQWVTQKLENAGVDLINVSSGIGGWRRPEGRLGEGYLVSDATKIKHATSLPVIGVGGIESGETIDRILQNEGINFTAVGRAILKNPLAWKTKNLCTSDLIGTAI
jgi:NADPH2 dehydrogenase